MSKRLNQEREQELQPKRMEYAKQKIQEKGFEIHEENSLYIKFVYRESEITFYPYSGWATGKTIKDGRGINNLISQLNQ